VDYVFMMFVFVLVCILDRCSIISYHGYDD